MKKFVTSVAFALICCATLFAGTAKTSFAIIADEETYVNCRKGIDAYRDVLQEEGLNVLVLHDSWSTPDPIRSWIIEKASDRKAPLEGVVLIGDVPIVMVRGAQHMTTAFKMDESGKFPEFECSVASDRFYDCFDMKFEYLHAADSVFYYKLSADGAQIVRPDIYSARIKVPAALPGDKYAHISAYLEKVVAAHHEQNMLDNMTFFMGNSYNSDCLTVWRQKPLCWRENFPYCFDRSSGNRFLNFRSNDEYKWNLFSELQRPGCDFFQFTEHGAADTQYINSGDSGSEADAFILQDALLSYYDKYKGTEDEEEYCHEMLDSLFHVSRELLSESGLAWADSVQTVYSIDPDITVADLRNVSTEARVVVFNACYNGSFYDPEGYIAGMHIFSDGKCIVAQGNTVNVLQDKWEDELVGYLSVGERIGMWQKEIPFLESHLIGDPTFRFTPHSAAEAKLRDKLHSDLVFKASDKAVWRKYMKSSTPLLRAAGVVHFASISNSDDTLASGTLRDMFFNEKSPMVRLHILNSLKKFADANRSEVLRAAFDDNYETVVRHAVIVAGASCDTTLIADLKDVMTDHPEMSRVVFQGEGAVDILSNKGCKSTVAADKSQTAAKRISAIRDFRNNRYPGAVDALVAIVSDDSDDSKVRTCAAEALGWYNISTCRKDIVSRLSLIRGLPDGLDQEVRKTIARLSR